MDESERKVVTKDVCEAGGHRPRLYASGGLCELQHVRNKAVAQSGQAERRARSDAPYLARSVMATATAVAATAFFEVAFLRHAAEFQSFADKLRDGVLHVVHLLLRVEETLGDGVREEVLAEFFEGGDFGVVEGFAGALFFLEHLALGHQGLILAADLSVGQESVNVLPHRADLGLVEDGLAEFAGFLEDRGFFGLSQHNVFGAEAGFGFFATATTLHESGDFARNQNKAWALTFRLGRRIVCASAGRN